MWQPKEVERALFRWGKWRGSLISQWMRTEIEPSQLSPDKLRLVAKRKLRKLGLAGVGIEVYWICSLVSNLNFDHEASFHKIVIPYWLQWWPLPYHHPLKLKPGLRIYPPWLMSDNDMDFARHQYGLESRFFKPRGLISMLLPLDHELFSILKTLRGRPRKRSKPGKPPKYPDCLAVKCTILKDSGKTYVQIGEKFGFKVDRPFLSRKCDTARHLVNRGRRLIN